MIRAGIDLGTTYSAIAHVNTEGVPTIFPDMHDADLFRTPSVVHVGARGGLVGAPVENLVEEQPDLPVARHTKLLLGKNKNIPAFRDHLGRDWSPEAINALILIKLRGDAEAFGYDELGEAVITVPAQFGDLQRRAVRRAAELANLRVASLVDEPVAAATYLAVQEQREQTLLLYDFGGGTFDATVLRGSPTEIAVLATDGDGAAGGKWIDEMIMGLMLEELRRAAGQQQASSAQQMQLRRLAEEVKLKLCKPGRTQVHENTLIGSQPFEFVMTQRHFEQLIGPMLTRSIEATERCLAAAQLEWPKIDQILLVGGSSLIPAVKQRLAQHSGKALEHIQLRQPQKAVAFGAALLAADTSNNKTLQSRIPCLQQVISGYDLGIRIRDPRSGEPAIYKLIKRNSPLPARATKTLRTSRADQTRLVIEVVQSKGSAEQALSLGSFAFGPIASPAQNYPVAITMEYDREGLVHVAAADPQTGQQMQMHMEKEKTLSHDDSIASQKAADAQRDLVASVPVNAYQLP